MPKVEAAPTALLTAAIASASTFFFCYFWNSRKRNEQADELERKRQEERTGRIRAEVKLRQVLAQQKHGSEENANGSGESNVMRINPIGTVVSPYPKRMGTPRQGMLVPSSRGIIQFNASLSPEAVDGIEEYSHIWVIFAFHANTSLATSKKSKIRPPRAGGNKVGQLATRSPHRPNAVGLSLVKMDRWDPSKRQLHIRALDLVDETPVYDIKPFVHWDIPPEVDFDISKLKLPAWVEDRNDVLPGVEFSSEAEGWLEYFIKRNTLAPLYPKKDPNALQDARKTLREILAQDPRSSHKGVSKNQRGSVSFETYRLLFCGVEVEFMVGKQGAQVVNIQPAPTELEEDLLD
eukprot:Nitzschia sp. Nitz4//scaffold25_size161228//104084//105130//NITZ4_002442-RA/size161228-processed-gene-0.192-mRNA-1//-1//CDS//3329544622//3235//frame0